MIPRRPALLRGAGYEYRNVEVDSGDPVSIDGKEMMRVNKNDEIAISLG